MSPEKATLVLIQNDHRLECFWCPLIRVLVVFLSLNSVGYWLPFLLLSLCFLLTASSFSNFLPQMCYDCEINNNINSILITLKGFQQLDFHFGHLGVTQSPLYIQGQVLLRMMEISRSINSRVEGHYFVPISIYR